MTRDQAVFVVFLIRLAAENPHVEAEVRCSLGNYGFEKLHDAEIALCKQYGIPDETTGRIPD